ncbi:Rpn family recombination-promoting nuclease/putative transposase [Clostridium botulinum]|uniref:Rpn family recombination-promoting nuclease/putative transposase n=1 Tax=Clostridium botulinum TaxID=1491 RepID=UPI001966D879|nr:Rpn family recombination-promoting nuclease/putative transposase [Clostridium botulinum]MBN1064979.1 Rpn family recombination-promoting nuclease/putative transposase [Clostridium botulinum]
MFIAFFVCFVILLIEKDMLVAWTEFLKDPESEKVRNLEMSIKEIREAKDELIKMSNNSKQREIYEMRAKILKDKVSALNKAREEGIEQGIKEGQYKEKINIAKKLLDILDNETIAIKTGLTIDKIQKLR